MRPARPRSPQNGEWRRGWGVVLATSGLVQRCGLDCLEGRGTGPFPELWSCRCRTPHARLPTQPCAQPPAASAAPAQSHTGPSAPVNCYSHYFRTPGGLLFTSFVPVSWGWGGGHELRPVGDVRRSAPPRSTSRRAALGLGLCLEHAHHVHGGGTYSRLHARGPPSARLGVIIQRWR